MSYLFVLNLGKGNCQQGFPFVVTQLWESDRATPIQFTGSLPAMPGLEILYQRWQQLYTALYSHLGWRQDGSALGFEIDETDITHVSEPEFRHLCQELHTSLNTWLDADSFRNVDRQLRSRLKPTDEIRCVMVVEDATVLRLPWSQWTFLEDYPKTEIALSPPEYSRSIPAEGRKPNPQVRILAVLGNRTGIDVDQDQQLLEKLPAAQVQFLVEPTVQTLTEQLWQPGWDILFFAGHSSSQGQGHIQLNSTESLTIDQLKYALKTAIANGLKLAIFNSCDGLGLATDLADLHIPQVIVMREPVPDRVAQEFLKYFLAAFAGGKSLYTAVRQAREKLQAWETEFPCATWLPVICQNPAEVPPTWQAWCRPKQVRLPKRREVQTLLLSSVVITSLILGVRWLGWLQPLELWAFDRLMQLRPSEPPDSRLLVVTVTEQDIQAQGNQLRRGSLSDQTLLRLLEKLESYQPRAIGLDIYRDFAAENPQLVKRLQRDRLITVCKRPDPKDDPIGVLPPPEVPEAQLGFSDFVQDPDGLVRRQLVFMSPNPASPCTPAYAFSVQLAFRYLAAKGMAPKFTADRDLQLGNVVFRSLNNRTGGYQPIDASGSQILLNYRATPNLSAIAQQVTLSQLLAGQVNPNAIQDRIVLVGITIPKEGDYWSTLAGNGFSQRIAGVMIHSHMVSQMLSAVLDRRSLLWVWPSTVEWLWVAVWALMGSALGWSFQRFALWGLANGLAIVILIGSCWFLLLQAGWVPLVPSTLALLISSGTIRARFSTQTVERNPG